MADGRQRFSDQTLQVLEAAGWSPGRDVRSQVEAWRQTLARAGVSMFPAAEAALREFGGLDVRQSGPGLELAREPFRIDPELADGEERRFAAHSRIVGSRLFPLGDLTGGHAYLAIAEDGTVFALMQDLWRLGRSMDDALESLILGRRSPLVATDVLRELSEP